MLRATSIGAMLVLASSALATTAAPVQRVSPDFQISEPGKQTVHLASFRGKVVVLEFLFIQSQHCLRVVQTLNKLHDQLGSRGFQPVGIVFDPPNVRISSDQLIGPVEASFKLTFPLGYATKGAVDEYLERTASETLNIPQVVVIDRAGRIRATSGGRGGNPALETEDSLRGLIDTLLKESTETDSNSR